MMGRSGAGKSTRSARWTWRLFPQISALVKPLSMFHNDHGPARLPRDREQPLQLGVARCLRGGQVRGVLERVGLAKEIFNQAGALSGGQQQRTSAARALYRRPTLRAGVGRPPDGAARGCLRLPQGCPEGVQSLRLR